MELSPWDGPGLQPVAQINESNNGLKFFLGFDPQWEVGRRTNIKKYCSCSREAVASGVCDVRGPPALSLSAFCNCKRQWAALPSASRFMSVEMQRKCFGRQTRRNLTVQNMPSLSL
uniref:Uncharacterized protein n=1 Tax=Nelumbo nucifera TaxID=4432 RepID=A0A822YQ23_NELNU|nr:TPA_asm: hypothetical protein HUJ06_012552 [Nelumbo nucifera]